MGIEWIIAIAAFLVGGGAGVGITAKLLKDKEPTVIVDNSAAVIDAEVAKELSNLDLIEPICAAEFIEVQGDGLCREMYCWAQTNSTTGEANGVACEAISNINNTIAIRVVCEAVEDETEKAGCYTLFRERK